MQLLITPLKPVTGAFPVATYSIDSNVTTWEMQQPSSVVNTVRYDIEIQSNGKLNGVRSVTTDAQKNVVSENWQSYGPIDVYDGSTDLIASFSESAEAQGACHG